MKASLLSLAFVAGLCVSARADFTIVQKVEGGKRAGNEIIMKLKGDKVRVEATPQMTMIVDGKTGETVTLMNAQKKFLRISGDKAKAISELAAKYGGTTAERPKLTATGKKMTINGYEAEEYVGETKLFKASYWIAPSFPDSAAIMKQLQAVIPSAWNDLAKGMMDYRDLPGFPLRTQVKTEGGEITSTITAIKRDLLSDAEFLVPADFQEMKIPNLQISGEKSEPPPSTKP
jgi:Domain of unknown function (DUF4412)